MPQYVCKNKLKDIFSNLKYCSSYLCFCLVNYYKLKLNCIFSICKESHWWLLVDLISVSLAHFGLCHVCHSITLR